MVLLLGMLLLAGFFYASYSIQAGIYVRAHCRGRKDRKAVALTFDDGPHPGSTPAVLDILEKHQVKAAFFCIGRQAAAYPEEVRRIAGEGHLVGNHSWSHRAVFPLLGTKKMKEELRRTQQLLEELTGRECRWFRPPFGVTNPVLAKVVRQLGYSIGGWSIRSLDTCYTDEETVFRRIRKRLHPGAVILLHDRLPGTAGLLEKLLGFLETEGYEIVRLDELFLTEAPRAGS